MGTRRRGRHQRKALAHAHARGGIEPLSPVESHEPTVPHEASARAEQLVEVAHPAIHEQPSEAELGAQLGGDAGALLQAFVKELHEPREVLLPPAGVVVVARMVHDHVVPREEHALEAIAIAFFAIGLAPFIFMEAFSDIIIFFIALCI